MRKTLQEKDSDMKKPLFCLLIMAILTVGGASSAFAASNLRMASGVVGSLNYALANGFAAVYQKHTGETLEVLTKELSASLQELYDGRYEIAAQANVLSYMIYNNLDLRTGQPSGVKTQPPIRLIMLGNSLTAGFLTLKSSGMTRFSDLKGKRATLRYGHSAAQFMVNVNMIAAGLEAGKDVTAVQASSIPSGAQLLNDGSVDACFGGTTVPAFRELDAAKGVRFLAHSPTPEAEARVRAAFPGAVFVTVQPDPGSVGIPEPTVLIGNHNALFSSTNIPDAVVYKFVKTIYENRHELAPYAPDFKDWINEPPANTYAAAPYHPGAIRFYREAGLWTAEMERWNQQLLDLYK